MVLASEESSRVLNGLGDQGGMCDFQQAIADCGLADLKYTGPQFTWWNHQDSGPIGKKLDRALVNSDWNGNFPDSFASFETNGISDHARCVVTLTKKVAVRKRRHFQFFNYLAKHPLFLETVKEFWASTEPLYHSLAAMHMFHKKLKALKPLLCAINRERYGDITRRTQVALQVLCGRQILALLNPCTKKFETEAAAAREWNHYAEVEEHFFKQKSRITWLKLGDHNTSFFHRAVQIRRAKNSLRMIQDANDVCLIDPEEIKLEAVNYFKDFLQSPHDQ